jgi:DNA-binding PadR family transcriptional regulator
MSDEIKLSHVALAVLGLIAEGESYPYELLKKIKERQMRNWTNIGQSSIYGVIDKLKEMQLIFIKTRTTEQNRIQRKLTITEKGKQILKERVLSILRHDRYMGRDWDLAFSNLKFPFISKEETIEALEDCVERLRENRTSLENRMELGKKVFGGHPPLQFRGLFVHALKVIAANIEFCNEVIEDLNKEKKAD